MKKMPLVFLLSLILVTSIAFVACSEPATTPTAPTSPSPAAPTPSEPAPPEPIEIIFSSGTPGETPVSQLQKQMGDMIEERSGGQVKFVYYWAGTLMPPPEHIKAVLSGSADIVYIGPDLTSVYMPITYNITTMPFMGYPSMMAETEIYQQLYDKFPAIQNEFEGMKLLRLRAMMPSQIHTAKKAVRVPEDIEGVRIAFTSIGPIAEVVEMAGGVPVETSLGDLNISLTQGVAEGFIDHFPVTRAFGLIPALPYHTILGESGFSMSMDGLIINEATWNKLSPEVQQIVIEETEWWVESATTMGQEQILVAMQDAEDLDHTFIELTPAEIQEWADLALGLHDKWIAEAEAEGIPAQEIYDEVMRLIEAYGE